LKKDETRQSLLRAQRAIRADLEAAQRRKERERREKEKASGEKAAALAEIERLEAALEQRDGA